MLASSIQDAVVSVGALPGFHIASARYEAGTYQSWHRHDDTRLIVTVRGGFTESWQRHRHCCAHAGALLRPAGETHADRYHAEGAVCVTVRFGAAWTDLMHAYGIRPGLKTAPWIGALGGQLFRELRRPSASPINMQSLVLDLISRFTERKSPPGDHGRPPCWIQSTKDLIRSRLDSPPDLGEVARLAGVHPAHLSRTFRRFTGMTMGAYLRRMRVEVARNRLTHTGQPLVDIAQDLGFWDQSHFSRVFREETGWCPKEFRRLRAGS